MKKVLIINGSYRESGDIAFLIENFLKGFRESGSGADIEVVHLKEIRMEYCRGCWACADPENIGKPIGNCPIEDDVRGLLEKSLACDILVYATPVYEMGPSAVMKKFLERNLPVVGGIKLGFYGRSPRRKSKAGGHHPLFRCALSDQHPAWIYEIPQEDTVSFLPIPWLRKNVLFAGRGRRGQ